MPFTEMFSNLVRKKNFSDDLMRNDLRKVLHLSDLTFLAIGSMIGSGLYVLTGSIAQSAGPSIVISYTLAAVASILSAVCYAEFAARIPITGSAYQFTYLSVGEIWAFVIGWNVFLEHVVLAASIAKGWSGYVDAMFGDPVKTYLEEHLRMPGGLLSDYPDFIAGALIILLTTVVAFGVKLSSKVNIFFAILNLSVIAFIIVTGFYLADTKNWNGYEVFFPNGWSATISGAATLIFSYVGYEVVASATEEAVKPKRDVPLSLLISLSFVVVAYVGASAALTLMVPVKKIVIASPFPSAYHDRGMDWAKYIVSVGALAAMTAALLSALLVVPRYLYAMARDGLLIPIFQNVNEKTRVPVLSTIISGAFCFVLAMIFSLGTLVEFISIGQLLACTFVAICVIKLRYCPNDLSKYEQLSDEPNLGNFHIELTPSSGEAKNKSNSNSDDSKSSTAKTHKEKTEETPLSEDLRKNSKIVTAATQYQTTPIVSEVDNHCGMMKENLLQTEVGCLFRWTTKFSPGNVPFFSLLIAMFFSLLASAMLLFGYRQLNKPWFSSLLVLFIILTLLSLCFITAFNQDNTIKSYKVPLVPFIPFVSIVVNTILILKLHPLTWIRFGIWMGIGLVIYFAYGYRHSKARKRD